MKNELNGWVSKFPENVSVKWGDVSHSLILGRTTLSDVVATDTKSGRALKIDDGRVSTLERENTISKHVDLELRSIEIESKSDSEIEILRSIGLGNGGKFDLVVAYEWDESDNSLELSALELFSDGLGRLHFSTSLEEVDLKDGASAVWLQAAALREARLNYMDEGFVTNNIDEADRTAFGKQFASLVGDNQVGKSTAERMVLFLEKSDELEISVRPSEPVAIQEVVSQAVWDSRKLIRRLNLGVR